MTTFRVFLGHADAKMPTKANPSDAGFDLYSVETVEIKPQGRVKIDTGIHLHLEPGWEAQIRARSGLAAKQGIMVVNGPGTIDANFRSNIQVLLYNSSDVTVTLEKGSRIAQMVIKEVPEVTLQQTDVLDTNTDRGTNGFGSSGIK